MKVSAVIIVKNEARNLQLLLPSLVWCDEIVIVDDDSTDDSLLIAEQYHCRVFQRKLDSFGLQKQYAVSQTVNDWVFSVDADELPSKELINEICQLSENNSIVAYSIRRKHEFMGKVFHFSSESRHHYIRLFNKQFANFNAERVHETVVCTGAVKQLRAYFSHHSFEDIDHYFKKSNFYSSLAAKEMHKKGKTKSLIVVMLVAPFLFLKTYLFDWNFMEGTAGFAWSLFQNWYRIVKYFKLKELK